jgi:hypothetical protein
MQLVEFFGTAQLFSEHDLANLFFNRHGSALLLCKARLSRAALLLQKVFHVFNSRAYHLRETRAG